MLDLQRKPRACAYVRVSTNSRDQEHSFAFQSEYWEDFIKQQNQNEYVGLYADEGISGKSIKARKQFLQMIEDAKQGKIDKIFTKSFTRFARNKVEALETIRELRQHNVSIYFDTEHLDTSTTDSDFVLSILATVAEEELIQVSENLKWAIDKRYQKGAVYINNNTLGLKMVDNKIVVDEEKRDLIKRIYKLYLDGCGIEKIAKILTKEKVATSTGKYVWHGSVIRSILTNEKYMGDSLQHKVYKTHDMRIKKNTGEVTQYYITNNHEAIIDKEDFKKVGEILATKSNNRNGMVAPTYPFSSKVVCGHDGKTFKRKFEGYKNKKKGIYKCKVYLKYTKDACNNSAILESELEKHFISAYNEFVEHLQTASSTASQRNELKEKLDKERELRALYINGYLTKEQYTSLNDALVTEIQKLDNSIKQQESSIKKQFQLKTIEEFDPQLVDESLEKVIINDYTATY